MIYVFDTSSLSKLKHFFPNIFPSIWEGLDGLFQQGNLISTKEVWNEMGNGNFDNYTYAWLKDRKGIFKTPCADELTFVGQIFQVTHFQSLIGEQQRLKGTPVADPFLIACAKVHNGSVVTEERFKPNAAKIPNVFQHFQIECIDLEKFMSLQNWNF